MGTSVAIPLRPSLAVLVRMSLTPFGVVLANLASLLKPIIIGAVSSSAAGSPAANARGPALSFGIPSLSCSVYISPVSWGQLKAVAVVNAAACLLDLVCFSSCLVLSAPCIRSKRDSTFLPTPLTYAAPNPPPSILGTIVGMFSAILSKNHIPAEYALFTSFSNPRYTLGYWAASSIASSLASSPQVATASIPRVCPIAATPPARFACTLLSPRSKAFSIMPICGSVRVPCRFFFKVAN